MKRFCLLLLLFCGLSLLVGTGQARANACDEVWHIAWGDRSVFFDNDITEKWHYESIKFPHYMGTICVDNVGKTLEFYPRNADFPFNYEVESTIYVINVRQRAEILANSKRPLIDWVQDEWRYDDIEIIRRISKAKPDRLWGPKFVKSKFWHEMNLNGSEAEFDFIGGPGQATARICDQVLYLAWDGKWSLPLQRKPENKAYFERLLFPYYMGSVCIDKVEKTVEFYPKGAAFPFNKLVEAAMKEINEEKRGEILADTKRLFSYWLWKALKERGLHVIRQTYSSEPDLSWQPKFIEAKRYYEIDQGIGKMERVKDGDGIMIHPVVPLNFDWTE